MPAAGELRMTQLADGDVLRVSIEASGFAGRATELFVALAEGGLSSVVTRGENAGRTLRHDHVVRALRGPLALYAAGAHSMQFQLDPQWRKERIGVVVFVQDRDSAEVLQTLAAPVCAG
jgi:hypothetical protein